MAREARRNLFTFSPPWDNFSHPCNLPWGGKMLMYLLEKLIFLLFSWIMLCMWFCQGGESPPPDFIRGGDLPPFPPLNTPLCTLHSAHTQILSNPTQISWKLRIYFKFTAFLKVFQSKARLNMAGAYKSFIFRTSNEKNFSIKEE